MRHHLIRFFVFTLISLYYCLPAAAQSPAKYKEIDDFIKGDQLKVRSLADIRIFGRELKRMYPDDELKARAAFFWLTQHIKYDCEGYRNGNRVYNAADVLATGRAVCSGYARLMKTFCDELGVECLCISGFATGISVKNVSPDNMQHNHEWVAVKINEKWRLVDPTWGSGSVNENCTEFYPMVNEAFFLSDPFFMIRSHFPEDARWQLLDNPYTQKQFADSVEANKKALVALINSWNNDSIQDLNEPLLRDSVIKRKVGEWVRLRLPKEDQRNFFSVMLYDKNDKLVEEISVPAQISEDGFYYCDYKVKRVGNYELLISLYNYTGSETEITGTSIVTYKLQVGTAIRKMP